MSYMYPSSIHNGTGDSQFSCIHETGTECVLRILHHGCMAAWLHGCMAAWLHGCMAAWLHGYWLHGCMVP
jgi:hypothetical protein